MSATVRLKDIVDALEMQLDDRPYFLDLDTGQAESVSVDLLHKVEEYQEGDDEPHLPKWQEREWEVAKRIVYYPVRFIKLPTKYEVHEWQIMADFAEAAESGRTRSELLNAIHGSGAFRYFQDTIRRHRIEKAWFQFRAQALREIAIAWCEEHHVVWKDE